MLIFMYKVEQILCFIHVFLRIYKTMKSQYDITVYGYVVNMFKFRNNYVGPGHSTSILKYHVAWDVKCNPL